MAYLIKRTKGKMLTHSVATIILESQGDAGELAFFLQAGIKALAKKYPHLNRDDPQRLADVLQYIQDKGGM